MSYSVIPSTFAKEDKNKIIAYLAQYSINAPQKFKKELKKYIGIIGETPNIFSTFNPNPYYRHVVIFGSYVMFYTIEEASKKVFIYRILHDSQNIEDIL
ncbi:MAG: type II toxin-antitoxin system RelE/ParE family toxin [Lachnospiraceae bacterium]|nr:type II toxin-antitoxin system RelE/ParE family toxin [Lachnospiraceae bacterium]